MLLFVELAAGAAAAFGVLANNSDVILNKNKKSKKDNSDDLDSSELSYPDDE